MITNDLLKSLFIVIEEHWKASKESTEEKSMKTIAVLEELLTSLHEAQKSVLQNEPN